MLVKGAPGTLEAMYVYHRCWILTEFTLKRHSVGRYGVSIVNIDGLVQDCSISIALAIDIMVNMTFISGLHSSAFNTFPLNTRRNNVVITSKRRRDVVLM